MATSDKWDDGRIKTFWAYLREFTCFHDSCFIAIFRFYLNCRGHWNAANLYLYICLSETLIPVMTSLACLSSFCAKFRCWRWTLPSTTSTVTSCKSHRVHRVLARPAPLHPRLCPSLNGSFLSFSLPSWAKDPGSSAEWEWKNAHASAVPLSRAALLVQLLLSFVISDPVFSLP